MSSRRTVSWQRALGVVAASAMLAGVIALPGTASAHGRWERGWHGDHFGWWWIDAGIWTLYSAAAAAEYPYGAYPYAYPYPPPVYVVPPAPEAPPVAPAPAAQVWYYCDTGQAYYPQVQSCPTGWRVVTVSQPQAAPMPPPPAPPSISTPAPSMTTPPPASAARPDTSSAVTITPVK